MTSMEDRPLHKLLSRSMVDIYVGPDNTHYVLHEKLLCGKSKYFSNVFYKGPQSRSSNKTIGLPDDDDGPFRLFVGWLYSSSIPVPEHESDLGPLFDLYLMGERWQIASLVRDTLDTVRAYYRISDTYPGLRRVQYVYANTDGDSPMRQLLVGCLARMLALGDGGDIPVHFDAALRRNGQLAVDVIGAVREWGLDDGQVPDPREDGLEKEVEKVKLVEEGEDNLEEAEEKKIRGGGAAKGAAEPEKQMTDSEHTFVSESGGESKQ